MQRFKWLVGMGTRHKNLWMVDGVLLFIFFSFFSRQVST